MAEAIYTGLLYRYFGGLERFNFGLCHEYPEYDSIQQAQTNPSLYPFFLAVPCIYSNPEPPDGHHRVSKDLNAIKPWRFTRIISKMPSSLRSRIMAGHQPHIVVLGGSYAGVSAVQNMLGLLQGRGLRPSPIPQRVPDLLPVVRPKITVLDRRDGFCQYH